VALPRSTSSSSAVATAARAPLFEVRKSSIQGRGCFAARTIRKGQRIIEYTGEHIDHEEADRRYEEDGMKRHHTFLFVLDDDTVVDGKVGGNESRFINHSCEPNCEAVIEGDEIWIHALRTIREGEELLYDYQYERTEAHTEEDEQFYACRCGAATCRGSILAPPKKPRRAASSPARPTKTTTRGTKAATRTDAKKTAKSARKAGARKGSTRKSTRKVATRAGR